MFFVHSTQEKFENLTSAVILDLCLRKTRPQKSVIFVKLRFQNVFRPHLKRKASISNSSGLKCVFEKLRFRDGLVWAVGQTVEIKLRFQISK